jgi:pantoate--beta-alanine ligase
LILSTTVFENIKQVRQWVRDEQMSGRIVGFVPTMGALHRGHITLVEEARRQCDRVVVSIFVNPTQFNNPHDLLKYPRTFEKDLGMLEAAGCDVLFHPEVNEMYPQQALRHWDFGALSNSLEGHFRPGHFDGVLTIVEKLFIAVPANKAFFGEKDFQQLALIKKMTEHLQLGIEIVGCPLIREDNGLALSSRNMRLGETEKKIALAISKTLFAMSDLRGSMMPTALIDYGLSMLANTEGLETEYLAIVDAETFEPLKDWSDSLSPIILVAAWVGGVRLLDNVILSSNPL